MYVFFDTETTGLPKDWKAPMTKLDNWPRVIQLAHISFDENRNLIHEACDLIKPDGWVMPTDKFWTDHGYTQEKNEKEGIPIALALDGFINSLDNHGGRLVAHNISYDYNVLGAEMIRAKKKASHKPERFCTKEASTNYCKLPGQYNQFKWPKLDELYRHLFQSDFDGAHDALNDVRATAKCFFELVDRKVIDLSKPIL